MWKALKMDNVKQINIEDENFMKSKRLNHLQFQEFLRRIGADYDVIIQFSEGRWLGQGKMLRRVSDLQSEIKSLMQSKRKFARECED